MGYKVRKAETQGSTGEGEGVCVGAETGVFGRGFTWGDATAECACGETECEDGDGGGEICGGGREEEEFCGVGLGVYGGEGG